MYDVLQKPRTVVVKVGTKVKCTGSRWKLDENKIFEGEIIKKKKFRSSYRYEIKWDSDGVVERVGHKDILPMISTN